MKTELTKNDIEKLFYEINAELAAKGIHGEILIAGGAALTLVYNARNSTQDIDAIYEPKSVISEIISHLAEKNNLSIGWLNDGVKGFITESMGYNLFKKYSNLTVNAVDAESLLAMKLSSARAVSRDLDDTITLMKHLHIKDEGHLFAILEKYIPNNCLIPKVQFFTQEAFNKYMNSKAKV